MSSNRKDHVIYTKVIFNPESMADEDGLVSETQLHLDEGMRIIHVTSEETITGEKG